MQTLLLTLAGLVVPMVAALAAGHALLNKREPRSALGWVVCCILLPLLGPMLYALFGINRTRASARRMRPEPDDLGIRRAKESDADTGRFPLSRIGRRVTQRALLACTQVDILHDGDEAYPRMLEAIESARERICLATYIFAGGEVSKRFIAALKAAQARGVVVRVILDAMGESMSFPPMGWRLRREGIPFRRFNPFTLFPPSLHINLRNHRKLLVVDGETAFTGGMNIGDRNCEWGKGAKRIQDLHFRVSGPVARDMEYSFLKDWHYCGKEELPEGLDWLKEASLSCGVDAAWSRLVLDGPNEDMDKLSDILAGVLTAAQRRIWIMTPYFLPDAELIGLLQGAALRGLDVKIVLPQANNIPVAHWACRHLLWQLLCYGVEVYYQPPPFSHAKLLLVDDDYCLVGSANLDPRSLRLNYELSLELFSREINAELAQWYEGKRAEATRYYLSDHQRHSLPVRLKDAAAWLFSPYL